MIMMKFKLNIRREKKHNLSDSGCWCQISQTADQTHPSLGFIQDGLTKRKHPVRISSLGENRLLMSEIRGK